MQGCLIIVTAAILATLAVGSNVIQFDVQTPPTNEDGSTTTWLSDQIATSLLGGPGMFWGAMDAQVVQNMCDTIVSTGDFTFDTTVSAYNQELHIILDLAATGGCGNAVSPGLVQIKYTDNIGHTYGIVCNEDARDTGLCGIWVAGADVSSIFSSGTGKRKLQSELMGAGAARTQRHLLDACGPGAAGGAAGGAITGAYTAVTILPEVSAVCAATGPLAIFCIGASLAAEVAVQTAVGAVAGCAANSAQSGCFPGHVSVQTPDGKTKLMQDVDVGDYVAVIKPDGKIGFDMVYAQGHADAEILARFVRLTLRPLADPDTADTAPQDVTTIQLTDGHFLPILANAQGSTTKHVRAADVEVGNIVFALSPDASASLIEGIRPVPHMISSKRVVISKGLYNPYTTSGTILVNSVVASCHSEWVLDTIFDTLRISHMIPPAYQALLAPLRLVYHVVGRTVYLNLRLHDLIMGAAVAAQHHVVVLSTTAAVCLMFLHLGAVPCSKCRT